MVHGGPGDQARVGYFALTQALVNHGYVVFDINNRGSTGYGKTFYAMDDRKHGEADLGDVVASKGMLAATGYVDSARIGILGGSYGGYMTLAALTLRPDAFKVGVDLFGISNWVRTLRSIPPWWGSFREALYAELGNPETDSARLRRISPLFNADKIQVPLMVLQGANDPRVLKVESDEIVAAVRRRGSRSSTSCFPTRGTGSSRRRTRSGGTPGCWSSWIRTCAEPTRRRQRRPTRDGVYGTETHPGWPLLEAERPRLELYGPAWPSPASRRNSSRSSSTPWQCCW